MLPGHGMRRGRPVRRGDRERFPPRVLGREEAAVHGIDADHSGGEGGLHGIEHEGDAFPFGPEHLRQLGGHGHRVRRRGVGPDLDGECLQQRRERAGFALQLVRTPAHRQDFAARHARHFRVHATDIPADHVVHHASVTLGTACHRSSKQPCFGVFVLVRLRARRTTAEVRSCG